VLPGPTYVKGFLRTYATYLKLDADELVEAYRVGFEPHSDDIPLVRHETKDPRRSGRRSTERRGVVPQRRHPRGYIMAAILAIVVIALLAWFGTHRGQDPASIKAENITTSSVQNASGAASSTDTSSASGDGQTEQKPPDVTVSTAIAQVSPPAEEGAEARGLSIVVNVVEGSCWLVVREENEGGAEIYAGTLSAGGQQTFNGARRYWMNVGQPESLTVTVGEKAYTLASPAGAFVVTEAGVQRAD
jgi:cytoskeletal protein RodZ